MALYLAPPIRLEPYFGYRNANRLVISARALRASDGGFDPRGRLHAIRTMLSHLASREEAAVAVTLELGAGDRPPLTWEQRTDRDGFVHFDVALEPRLDLPAHPMWEAVTLRWLNRDGPQSVSGHVLAPGRESRLAVISDIDDTIIETGVTGGMRTVLRNWRRLLAEMPAERIAAPGADAFYGTLGGGTVGPGAVTLGQATPAGNRPNAIDATYRPFFYVSSSPWNLFAYLVAFMRSKALPIGPLLLRNWGWDRATFGSGSHGAHKTAAVGNILATYPDMRFALIGDDTQGDLPAYAAAVTDHPGRIAAIFIRTLQPDNLTTEEQQAKTMIEASGVPLWLGNGYGVGTDFLATVGFHPGGETEQIVRAVETPATIEPATAKPVTPESAAPAEN